MSRADFTIREAQADDYAAIDTVLRAAFDTNSEALLTDTLRRDGDVALELLAEQAGQVVAMVLLSTLQAPARALALAPVAVLPELQGTGIGSALIDAAIAMARFRDCPAIFLLGEPGYYERFGFSVADARPFDSPYPPEYMMALLLRPEDLNLNGGPIIYSAAFAGL